MGKKLSVVDFLVVIFCLSGTVFAGYLFWRDLNKALTKHTELPVGFVTYKYNATQRRFQDRLVWNPIQKNSPVYNGDLIRTADLSDAVITFENADSVSLSENSLIQIFYNSGEGARLELSGGNISVDSRGEKMIVSSGGKELVLANSSRANVGSGEELSVRVIEGNASLNAAGTVHAIEAGSAVSVVSSGEVEQKAQVTVISPPPNHTILSAGKTVETSFSLKTSHLQEGDRIRLDLAADRRFPRILHSGEYDAVSLPRLKLSPGIYWWRAYVINNRENIIQESVLSAAARGKLTVIEAPAPELQSPADGKQYTFLAAEPEIRFRWSTPAGTGDEAVYLLQVADNPRMRNPLLSQTVDGFSYTATGLGEGVRYWQIIPRYPGDYEGSAAISPLASFVIRQEGDTFAAETPTAENVDPASAVELLALKQKYEEVLAALEELRVSSAAASSTAEAELLRLRAGNTELQNQLDKAQEQYNNLFVNMAEGTRSEEEMRILYSTIEELRRSSVGNRGMETAELESLRAHVEELEQQHSDLQKRYDELQGPAAAYHALAEEYKIFESSAGGLPELLSFLGKEITLRSFPKINEKVSAIIEAVKQAAKQENNNREGE